MRTMLVVDDHPLITEAIRFALTNDDLAVDAADPTRDEPARLVQQGGYDFCLLDLDWGVGSFAGVGMISECIAVGTNCLVLTGTGNEGILGYCLELGASGVVRKAAGFSELMASIRRGLAGGSVNSDSEKYRWLLSSQRVRSEHQRRLRPFDDLTAAEGDVLADLMRGRVVSEIASARVIAESTVRTHVRQILRKLEVQSQLTAVALARQAGWRQGAPHDHTASAHHQEMSRAIEAFTHS